MLLVLLFRLRTHLRPIKTSKNWDMETNIASLQLTGLKIILTTEKLYIQTILSQESIALRSVNGIGVRDLVDKYSEELTAYKELKKKSKVGIFISGLGIFTLLLGILALKHSTLLITGVVFFGIGLFLYNKFKNIKEPSMKSVVRILIMGADRDFEFDKGNSNSTEVANFVAQVESTLSAFHKN
jgi:hypothetical protein